MTDFTYISQVGNNFSSGNLVVAIKSSLEIFMYIVLFFCLYRR